MNMKTKKTANISSYYSSDDVAKLLGVNVATVKRWTDSGKLECLKTAGGHRKFLGKHISAFVKSHEKYANRLSVLPAESKRQLDISGKILDADFAALEPLVLQKALDCEYDELQQMLNGIYMVHQDLALLYDDLLTPILHRIGELWSEGKLSVAQEHLASQALRDATVRLQEVVNQEDPKDLKCLVITLRDELHDIPAKFAQHILAQQGYLTLYSGQATPSNSLAAVYESFKPERVYLSSTYFDNPEAAQEEVDELVRLCRLYKTRIYAGGAGLAHLSFPEDSKVTFLNNYREVASS